MVWYHYMVMEWGYVRVGFLLSGVMSKWSFVLVGLCPVGFFSGNRSGQSTIEAMLVCLQLFIMPFTSYEITHVYIF